MKKIAIFCSGSGSNAEKICVFFSKSKDVSVVLIATNNKNAFVIERAKKLEVPFFVFSKKELNSFSLLQRKLEEKQVSHIVLAGFLLKIPSIMISAYAKKIINIKKHIEAFLNFKKIFCEFVFSEFKLLSIVETIDLINITNDITDKRHKTIVGQKLAFIP